MEGNKGIGRPRRMWMDGSCLNDRRLIIPEDKECVKDRGEREGILQVVDAGDPG